MLTGREEGKEGAGGWKDLCKEGLEEGGWKDGGRDGKEGFRVWEGGWKEGGWDWKERKETFGRTPKLKAWLENIKKKNVFLCHKTF